MVKRALFQIIDIMAGPAVDADKRIGKLSGHGQLDCAAIMDQVDRGKHRMNGDSRQIRIF